VNPAYQRRGESNPGVAIASKQCLRVCPILVLDNGQSILYSERHLTKNFFGVRKVNDHFS